MTYSFHPEARTELNQAVDYYENCQSGLGSEFLNEVEAAIERILQFPEAWSNLSHRTRRCLTNRFPYGLIYQTQEYHIRIIAVAHSHRHPRYWVDRFESS